MLAAGWRQFRSELGEFSQVPGIGRMPQGATLLPVNLTFSFMPPLIQVSPLESVSKVAFEAFPPMRIAGQVEKLAENPWADGFWLARLSGAG
jgi:hypothetical protein